MIHISKADADDWLRSRGAIIEALEKAGLCLWSNAEEFWIAPAPAAMRDKARLDSGCIVIRGRDEFGEPQAIEHRGIDLRAAIDDAIRSRNAKRRFCGD